jgi:hypothetical protein
MTDITVHTLRTIAKTPWGFMAYAGTTLEGEVNPITLENARKDNLRVVQDRLTPGGTFPGHQPRTPVADTTITISETLVKQDLMGETDDHVERFEEYEIEYWKMTG